MDNFEKLNLYTSEIGKNPMLVQGAGGNCSMKLNDQLIIKSSGSWMGDALDKNIFISLPLATVQSAINQIDKDKTILDKAFTNLTIRPSIETGLHTLMPHKFVFHVHSIDVLAIAITSLSETIFNEKLKNLKWKYIKYAKPGSELIYNIKTSIGNEKFDILILENHGLVVGADTINEISNLIDDIVKRISRKPLIDAIPNYKNLEKLSKKYNLKIPLHNSCHSIAMSKFKTNVAIGGSLYPDHVVFFRKRCCFIKFR